MWRNRLPERLPTQWSGAEIISTQPTFVFFMFAAVTALLAAVFGFIAGLGSADRQDSRRAFLVTGIFSGLAAAAWMISAGLSVTAVPGTGPVIGPWGLLSLMAAGYGFLPYLVARRRPTEIRETTGAASHAP
jgi:hypothetical protein